MKPLKQGITSFLLTTLSLIFADVAQAQLIPDNTVGTTVTNDTVNLLRDLIQGGTISGNALFHSFEDFNVGEGREVFFDLQNNADILNIFTRVTGSNSSSILGTLGVLQDALNSNVLGNANLFLLNPNGISFGGNANLQLNGSFFATTADSFDFDNFSFSASGEEVPPPLLTISIPRFLSFRDNPGTIENQSVVETPDGDRIVTTGLQVPKGETIGLIGGEILFTNGGTATTRDGRIEVGAVGGSGLVSYTPQATGPIFGYEGIEAFDEITLDQGSRISTTTERGTIEEGRSDIQLRARNITLSGSSRVDSNNQGASNPGEILINSSRLVIEQESQIQGITVGQSTNQTGTSIDINTGELVIQSGGRIVTFVVPFLDAIGAATAGDITINATDSVQVIGGTPEEQDTGIFVQTLRDSIGDAGNLTIKTARLLIQDGGLVTADTRGVGDGGDIVINASESVQIIGERSDGDTPSFLFTEVQREGTGNAGNLTINTPQLLLQDGGQASVRTRGEGNGGNLTVHATDIQVIGRSSLGNLPSALLANAESEATGDAGNITFNAAQLLIQAGAQINATTSGIGNGGNIKLNIDDTILIEGTGSGIFSTAETGSTGNAGSITIDPQQVTVRDFATISVSSQGSSKGGNINLTSDNLTLDNGRIIAATNDTDGGNINLNIANSLLLRNGNGDPLISTEAGNNGGNINIDADLIVALPGENSDISANGSQGRGGSITIRTSGIFGIQEPDGEESDATNDITATGGISGGNITITVLESDFNQEVIDLPEEVVESADITAQSVCSQGFGSQLNNTGRGGVPQIPGFIIRNDVVDVDLAEEVLLPAPPPEAIKPYHRTDVTLINSEGEEYKPAMGAVLLPDGMVEFVDYNPAEVYRDMYAAARCNR